MKYKDLRPEDSKKYHNNEGIDAVTNFQDAAFFLRNSIVLCNNIINIDNSILENMEESEESEESLNNEYQYYITDCTERDVQYLKKRFNLRFTYSDLLDCYVLCVFVYGTSWEYCYCKDNAIDPNEELMLKK